MSTKATWLKAALHFITVEAARNEERILLFSELSGRHLESMVRLTASIGKTPRNTLARVCQEIRDAGIIEFMTDKRPGTYRLLTSADEIARFISRDDTRASRGERTIAAILKSLNIEYQREKTFADLYSRGRLRFDFYFRIGRERYAIEYDGIQHHIAVEFFGGIPELIARNLRDKTKDRYAVDKGIHLLRVRGSDARAIAGKIRALIGADTSASAQEVIAETRD